MECLVHSPVHAGVWHPQLVFDYMTFGVLLWWRDTGPAESRTGWFLVAVRGLDDDGAGALDGQSALNPAFYWNRADRALDGRRLLA